MKPSDLYLSSRHLFGFLVPGIVWVLAINSFLTLELIKPIDLVPKSLPLTNSGVAVGLFLFSSFIAGLLFQWPSYALAKYSERWKVIRYLTRHQDSGHHPKLRDLEGTVFQLLDEHHKIVSVQLPRPEDKGFRQNMSMFRVCKRTILSRSPELSRSLLEIEDEINLCGMLLLPLGVLFILVAIHLFTSSTGTLLSDTYQLALLGALWLVSEAYLASRFAMRRIQEKKECYNMFLLLESDLLDKAGGSPQVDEIK